MTARTPTGKPRGRPKGCVKTGGRVRKSLDKGERQLVSAELAGSILTTFERLGGVDDMLSWASANRTVFYTQVLSRLYPAAQRGDDDPGVQVNVQTNVSNDFEAARRIAFSLAKAAYEQAEQEPALIEAEPEPEFSPRMWRPPADAPDMPEPVEALDPARERWASELPLTPEQRADNALVRELKEVTLETYRGGPGEQFDAPARPSSRKLSPGERCRALSRRGRDLL